MRSFNEWVIGKVLSQLPTR